MDRIISGSQSTILWKLDKHGPQKVTTIAEQMSITPGAVTSLSDKLIANGYANRNRATNDRRVVYLEITEKGKELLHQLRAEIKSSTAYFFAGLSDEDLEHLVRIYRLVLKNMDEQNR